MDFTGFYLAIAGILIAGSGGLAALINFGIQLKILQVLLRVTLLQC